MASTFTPFPASTFDASTFNLPSRLPNPEGATAGHWDYPNYAELLDKWMQPFQQQYEGNIQALKAQTDANSQLANTRYSEGPTSTLSRLAHQEQYGSFQHGQNAEQALHQHNLNLMSLTNALAARGILSSGEKTFQDSEEAWRYGHQTGAENEAYKQQQSGYQQNRADASNQLLDYMRGLQQAFADAQRQGLDQLAQQKQSTAETLSQLYRPSWVDESAGTQGAGGASAGAGFTPFAGGVGANGLPIGAGYNPGYVAPGIDPGYVSAITAGFNSPPSSSFATPPTRPIREIPEGW